MWKLEREEDYFRIYDSKKDIAGYFDPDYGELFPKEKETEIIQQMHKNQDKISGGFFMVPMVKFGIFNNDDEIDIDSLDKQIGEVQQRISVWKNFLLETKNRFHGIRESHTDQDMLSISFPIKFDVPTALEKNLLLQKLEPTLDLLQKQGLL
ncbi:MAG TPA: hypothetical protein VD731_02400 [Nitrosopumilaceae archaeon]|nr:hypothetical protein [Nitrosopumilaceae archaeon]